MHSEEGPGAEFEAEAPHGSAHARDRLRRMWRPVKEFVVEGFRVKVPQAQDPVEIRVSRYLDADERRELFLICQDAEREDRPWMLLVYPHAMEDERSLMAFLDALSQPRALGSRDEARHVVRAVEAAMGLEREAYVEAQLLDAQAVAGVLAGRTERLNELLLEDNRKARGLLAGGKPPKKSKPRDRNRKKNST
jgi:hypothetical protein